MSFTIPTIYTAIDRFSAPVMKMSGKAREFGKTAEASLNRLDRKMRPIGKQAALIGTAMAAPLVLFANEARKSEESIAAFRTIVSDLSDKDFAKYEKSIKSIGDRTKTTYADVASSFEKIAGLNEKFAKTPESIQAITEATIVLSRASKQDLGQSAENLVGIMNQFNLQANEANRTINVLAAGQAVGAASISQTAEAFVNVGSVAAGANVSLEQSVALIQTLGKFSIFGSEAGTKLRGVILRLQKSGVGYASGQFKINDALDEASKKMNQLKNDKQKDAFLNKMFGAENIAAGRIILSNIGIYKEFTTAVTGTSEAQKAAAINQNTFSARLQKAKAQALNLAVSLGEKLLPPLNKLFDKIIPVIDSMSAWAKANPNTVKTILFLAAGIAALSYTIAGVSAAIALGTKVMAAYNFVMSLNPVWILVTGIGLLVAATYMLIQSQKTYTTAERVNNQVRERALENTIDQRAEVTMLFAALRKATVGTQEYSDILRKIETIQPGITKQYNLQAGSIERMNEAEKALTKSIMDRAMAEARAEIMREKTKELLKEEQKGPSAWDYTKAFFSNIGNPLGGSAVGIDATMNKADRMQTIQDEINVLADQIAEDKKQPVNTKETQANALQNIVSTNNATLGININDPGNNVKSVSNENKFVTVKTSPSKQVP